MRRIFGHRAILAALAAAGLSLALLAASGCRESGTSTTQPAGGTAATQPGVSCSNVVGQEMPAAEAAALREKLIKQFGLGGKVTLIQFGIVGYPLSDQGLEGLILHQRLQDVPGLALLRVDITKDQAAADAFYKEKDIKFPVYRDANTQMARAFQATSDPTYVILDKFGRVRYRGPEPDARLGDWAQQLQAQTADAGAEAPMLGVVELSGEKLLSGTKLPDLGGQLVELEQAMGPEGLVVLLVDTTCPFSGEALRDMPAIAPVLAKAQVGSIVINIDGTAQRVAEYYKDKDLGTQLIFDETPATMKAWNITSVPTVFYIGPDMKIGYNGAAVWAQVAAAIETARQMPQGALKFTPKGTSYG